MSDDLYFEPPSRLQLVDKLVHLLRFTNTFLILSGSSGAGVSTIIKQLQHLSNEDNTCILLLNIEQTTNVSMLHQLLNNAIDERVQPSEGSGEDPLIQLHQKIENLKNQQLKFLILIDNADFMKGDAIDSLVNLQEANQGSMAIVIGGSEKIASLASGLVTNDNFSGNLHTEILSPFTQLETEEFIQLRFVRGGDFSKKQLADIYKKSLGYPGRTTKLTTEIIQSGKVKFNQKALFLPIPHMIGIGLLLTGISGVSLWQYSSEDPLIVNSELSQDSQELPLVITDVDDAPIGLDTAPPDFNQQASNQNLENQEFSSIEDSDQSLSSIKVIKAELDEHRTATESLENQISSLTDKIKAQESLLDNVSVESGDTIAQSDNSLTYQVPDSIDTSNKKLQHLDTISVSDTVQLASTDLTAEFSDGSDKLSETLNVKRQSMDKKALLAVEKLPAISTADNIIDSAQDPILSGVKVANKESHTGLEENTDAVTAQKISQRLDQLALLLKQNINPKLLVQPSAKVTTQAGVEVQESSFTGREADPVIMVTADLDNTVIIASTASSDTARLVQSQPIATNLAPKVGNWSGASAIKKWPSSGFTLQILAAKSEASVIKFLKSAASSQKMYHFETMVKNQPWNVIVYGQYSSRAAAHAAISKLPIKLRRLKPWVKSIKSVKNSIK